MSHLNAIQPPSGKLEIHEHMGGDMDRVKAMIRQAERDVFLADAVLRALATIRLLHTRRLEIEETGYVIDLRADIQRLVGALTLLGYSSQD